jgi:hypothetical protein
MVILLRSKKEDGFEIPRGIIAYLFYLWRFLQTTNEKTFDTLPRVYNHPHSQVGQALPAK